VRVEGKGINLPCDTIITAEMAWASTTSPTILVESLQAAGYLAQQNGNIINFSKGRVSGYFNTETCQMRIRNAEGGTEGQMKVAYSKLVVESQGKRFGWKFDWKTNAAGNAVATVRRRAS